MRHALPTEVSRAIRVLRVVRGLSIAQFAERSQLSATYLRQVERGERDLGIGALGLIADALECDVRLLLPGEGRSALASIVAELFDDAPEAAREAILFLLTTPDDSPKKQAIIALTMEESEPPPPPESRPPERAVSGRPAPTKRSLRSQGR